MNPRRLNVIFRILFVAYVSAMLDPWMIPSWSLSALHGFIAHVVGLRP